MIIQSYSLANNPFDAKGRSSAFIGAKYEYSCVGLIHVKPRDKVVTAVGAQELVAALHYGLSPGQTVNFVNTDGMPVTVKVVKQLAAHGDVQVLEVDQPWATLKVKPATIAQPTQIMTGAQTLVFGETPASTDIATFGQAGYQIPAWGGSVYLASIHGGSFTLEPGDSGAPDFLVTPNGLALLGPHYSILPTLYLTSLLFPFSL